MKLVLFISGLLFSSILMAQKKEGVLIYERKQNMHRTISAEMRALIPEFRSSKHLLYFTESKSLYKTMPKEEAPDPFSNTKGAMSFNLGGGTSEIYFDFGQNKKLTVTDLFGDPYLIMDTIKKYNWNVVNETKTIAGYTCKKAVATTKQIKQMMRIAIASDASTPPPPVAEETEVIAWYATEITTPAGPEGYIGLPGVIMELDIDKGSTVFTVEEVRPLTNPSQIKEPKKGRKVTPEAYSKEMKKAIENMRSGPIQIRGGSSLN